MTDLMILATPEGRWVLPDSEEFLALLGDPAPDYDAVGFAVRNLGFIKFQVIGQSIIEVELHPRNVELPALLAVQQQLVSSEIKLFRIRHLDTSWQSEISSSVEHAVARLSELCAPLFTPPRTERFLVEPRDYTGLFTDEANPLRPLVQKWRVSFGHFDPNFLTIAINNQLFPRLMIIGIKPRQQDPEWRFIGSGQLWAGRHYQIAGVGQKVANMPDREYGEWLCEFYKSVAVSSQPRYDLVTASMQYQDEPGKPRRIVHYERLLLPWKTPSDEVLVTGCARLVDDKSSASVSSAPDNSAIRNPSRSW